MTTSISPTTQTPTTSITLNLRPDLVLRLQDEADPSAVVNMALDWVYPNLPAPEPFPAGSNSGLVCLLWNVASHSAETEQKCISRLLARGLKDHQVIAWLPAGEVPKVALNHFTQESGVPVALGDTVFGNPDFWQAIRSHAANAGLVMLRAQAGSVHHTLEFRSLAIWTAGRDGVIRNTKHRDGPLMAPYLIRRDSEA